MSNEPDSLVFFKSPEVEYASNFFKDVPVILQYDDSPLIEVIQEQDAGFTTQFKVFNQDGVYIAKVKGSQLFLTGEGSKSNLILRHPANITVCELDGQTLFEVRRKDAAALRTEAELYAPDGRFIKANNQGFPSELVSTDGSSLRVGGLIMIGNYFSGCRVGIHLRSNGSIGLGKN
jgi:hypothetical protein